MANFSLYNLEYTNTYNLISCVQKWIDLVKPQCNSNPIAGSSKGYKHNKDAIEKMRSAGLGKTHTEQVKISMSENPRKKKNPF